MLRFIAYFICLLALTGLAATIEKVTMAVHMIEKFGMDWRVPVLFNPSTFYIFLVIAALCVFSGVLLSVRRASSPIESKILKVAVTIHVLNLASLAAMIAFDFATLN